jgi:hypothetical protein
MNNKSQHKVIAKSLNIFIIIGWISLSFIWNTWKKSVSDFLILSKIWDFPLTLSIDHNQKIWNTKYSEIWHFFETGHDAQKVPILVHFSFQNTDVQPVLIR